MGVWIFSGITLRTNTAWLVGSTLKRTSIGSLSKDILEQHTSTGGEAYSLFICLDANKFVLLSFSSLKTIYPRVSTKPLPNDAKSLLQVNVRHSKTLLLKLPIGVLKEEMVWSTFHRLIG